METAASNLNLAKQQHLSGKDRQLSPQGLHDQESLSDLPFQLVDKVYLYQKIVSLSCKTPLILVVYKYYTIKLISGII